MMYRSQKRRVSTAKLLYRALDRWYYRKGKKLIKTVFERIFEGIACALFMLIPLLLPAFFH